MYGCAGVGMYGRTGVQAYGCTGVRVYGRTGVHVYGLDFSCSVYASVSVSDSVFLHPTN